MFLRFIRNQTYRIFSFLHISLTNHRNFRNWHQHFYSRSGSYKIHALSIYKCLVYRSHENIDYLVNHIQPNFNPFPKHGLIYVRCYFKAFIKGNASVDISTSLWRVAIFSAINVRYYFKPSVNKLKGVDISTLL